MRHDKFIRNAPPSRCLLQIKRHFKGGSGASAATVASAVESIDNGHGGGSRLLSRAVDLGGKLGFCRLLDEGREKK
ncbi:hypothetical protein ACFX1Z_018606 [Malus domestica]